MHDKELQEIIEKIKRGKATVEEYIENLGNHTLFIH